ncbi:MAG: porin [Methylococcales bacterium]|jgi:general bacterial porin, GBP family|nr:porin [Methylococcales bacterium]MBT7444060.1 porin [Methylococcales bacterium]
MKTILGFAIGSLLAAVPFASSMADVKIYGSVQAEYSNEDLDGQSAEQGVDDDFRTRIGFKAWEKLGNGMTAVTVLEFNADSTGDRNNGLRNRQLFVGLKHKKWGFLKAGTISSPYKLLGGAKIDGFYDTALQAAGAGGMSQAIGGAGNVNGNTNGLMSHDGFVESAISYRSPSWNNMTLHALISPDEKVDGAVDNGVATPGADDGDDNDWVVGLTYRNGPIWAWIAHASNNVENQDDEVATKIGAQMAVGAHSLAFQYEWIQDSASLNSGAGNVNGVSNFSSINAAATGGVGRVSTDGDIWFLGYQFKAGNNLFIMQLGGVDSEDRGALEGNDSDYFAIGMIHSFSKKTKIITGYSESDSNDVGTTDDREVVSIALRKDF